jgi:hypothetical protein
VFHLTRQSAPSLWRYTHPVGQYYAVCALFTLSIFRQTLSILTGVFYQVTVPAHPRP